MVWVFAEFVPVVISCPAGFVPARKFNSEQLRVKRLLLAFFNDFALKFFYRSRDLLHF